MTWQSEILADSPLAWWRMDDTSGTTTTDSSGNSRNGTYSGSPSLNTSGLIRSDANTAVTFDGVDDRVDVSYASWMNVTNLTVEMVLKTPTPPSTNRQLMARDDGGTTRPFTVAQGTSREIRFTVFSSDNSGTPLIGPNLDECAHHIVCTYVTSTRLARIYYDGVEVIVDSRSDVGLRTSLVDSMTIAYQYDSGTRKAFYAGIMDEVAYYDHALSAARVLAHYNAGPTVRCHDGWNVGAVGFS